MKELVDDYQQKTKSNQSIQTIGELVLLEASLTLFTEDIKQFVTNYPDFKKLSGNVTKHVVSICHL